MVYDAARGSVLLSFARIERTMATNDPREVGGPNEVSGWLAVESMQNATVAYVFGQIRRCFLGFLATCFVMLLDRMVLCGPNAVNRSSSEADDSETNHVCAIRVFCRSTWWLPA